MNLMIKVELLRGQKPIDSMVTMESILCHSFEGNSLVCNHSNSRCWKNSNNPYYLALMCHMIFCHASLSDGVNVISLVNQANQIAAFGTAIVHSKELQNFMQSKDKTGNHFTFIICVIYHFVTRFI